MTKQIIGKGHVSDGLYILDVWVPRSVACSSIASSVKAHCRLGHPSFVKIQILRNELNIKENFYCDDSHYSICHYAKQRQLIKLIYGVHSMFIVLKVLVIFSPLLMIAHDSLRCIFCVLNMMF